MFYHQDKTLRILEICSVLFRMVFKSIEKHIYPKNRHIYVVGFKLIGLASTFIVLI